MAAVLDAAARLFDIRDIAAAMTVSIEGSQNTSTANEKAFQALLGNDSYWRAPVRGMLDGEEPRELRRNFPTVRRLNCAATPRARKFSQFAYDITRVAVPVLHHCRSRRGHRWRPHDGLSAFRAFDLDCCRTDMRKRRVVRNAVGYTLNAIIEGPASITTAEANFEARAYRQKPLKHRFGSRQCGAPASSEEVATVTSQVPK